MPTEADWVELTPALDPWAEIPLTEASDALYVEMPCSPSDSAVRRLRAFQRSAKINARQDPPPKFLYCGARGGGKTTQLRRLFRALKDEDEVLLLDLAPVLGEQVTTIQLIAHLGLALIARLGQWEGADGGVERVLKEDGRGFGDTLSRLVEGVDLPAVVEAVSSLVSVVAPGGAGLAVGAGVSLIRALTGGRGALDPARSLARAERFVHRLEGEQLEDARRLTAEVSRLARALHGRSSKPVVALVDGLDKVLALDGVLEAFTDVDLLRSLDAAVVFTAPAALSSDVRFLGMRQDLVLLDLQNIPVVDAEGTVQADHVASMVDIAVRRIPEKLRPLLSPEALAAAARASSGVPRDFLSFLSDAAQLAEEQHAPHVTPAHVAVVTKQWRLRMQKPLTVEDVRLLGRVLKTRRLPDGERASELLFQNLIAWYPNENGYHRPHEILVDWVRAEATRLGDD